MTYRMGRSIHAIKDVTVTLQLDQHYKERERKKLWNN